MVYVLLAEGFEEIEAVTVADVLRRGGVEAQLVGVGGRTVTGSHGISLCCDTEIQDIGFAQAEMVYLPGGMPGTKNLGQSSHVRHLVEDCAAGGKWVCALCAAPVVLGQLGLLKGKKATCYPGFEQELTGAVEIGGRVVRDGNIITGVGPGAALTFALTLLEALRGKETALAVKEAMQCR